MTRSGQDPSISSRDEYRIPLTYITECKSVSMSDLDRCPIIVFVNSRSGGRAGEAIHDVFSRYLGSFQVVRCHQVLRGICIVFVTVYTLSLIVV